MPKIRFIYLFNIKKSKTLGQLEITVRKIDNGDVFVFSKLINTSDTGLSLPLQIVFKNHSSFNLNSFEEKIKQEHNRVFGIDYMSNVKGLYTIEGKKPYQLFLSQNYLSKELVETYEDGTKSVLRELVNSVNYLFDFKGDKELWETEYTSAWLKKDYGIQAPYTDTRHNENIALFLSNAGKILKNEQIQQSDLLYANYLTTQQELGNILSTDYGYFILDYYSKNQKKKTHVSLNHLLG